MAFLSPFHLAIPVSNLDEAKNFYEDKLECKPGRFHQRMGRLFIFWTSACVA